MRGAHGVLNRSGLKSLRLVAPPRARFLSRDERRSLEAAADELIPEGDGMPAAGDVGAVAYIEVVLRHWPDLRKHIKTALKELDRAGRRRFQNKFRRLDSSQRIELLETFEKDTKGPASDPGLFTVLSDLVYEAYYTSPKVWPLIGYKHHTPENGPPLEPFDPRVLAQVQERPKSYREIE